MGHEIVYCCKCSTRLLSEEFDKGKAIRLAGDRVACITCAVDLVPAAPTEAEGEPELFKPPPPPPKPPSKVRTTQSIPIQRRTERNVQKSQPPEKKKWPILVGVAAGVVVLVVVVIAISGGGGDPDEQPVEGPPFGLKHSRDPVVPREDPGALAALKALSDARAVVQSKPADFDAQIAAYEAAMRRMEGTPQMAIAFGELATIRANRSRAWQKEIAQFASQAKVLTDGGRYGDAIALWKAARKRHADKMWGSSIDRNEGFVRQAADAKYIQYRARAVAARQRDDLKGEKAARDQVVAFGMPDLLKKLDARLATMKPRTAPPKTASPAMQAYRKVWRESMALAAGRKFRKALALLRKADTADKEVRAEAEGDLRDVEAMTALVDMAIKMLAATPSGRWLELEVRDPKGGARAVKGAVRRATGARVELRPKKGKSVFVEFGNVTAASLGMLLGDKGDMRALEALCRIEGDVKSAAFGGGIPEKYAVYAKDARGRIPKPDRRELEARSLFYEAERKFASTKTLGEGVATYVRLLEEYPTSSVVLGETSRITERSVAGKEFLSLASGLVGRGAFRRARHKEKGTILVSTEDVGDEGLGNNYVEFSFYHMPDATYRVWVYAGACCKETGFFYVQGTGLTMRVRGKEVSIEPGGNSAMEMKPSSKFVTKSRHTLCKAPKQPSRWAWIPITRPKKMEPGPKILRFLTDQKGFAVGGAIATSLRTKPPDDKEIAKLREAEPKFEEMTAGLIAYWKFDEGKGSAPRDSGPRGLHGKFVKKPRWGRGAPGMSYENPAGLEFGGKDDWVEVPGGEALINGLKAFTIALWVKSDVTGVDRGVFTSMENSDGDNGFSLRYDKAGSSGKGTNVIKCAVTTTDKNLNMESASGVQTTNWQHLAMTWKSGGGIVLYVDGRRDSPTKRSDKVGGKVTDAKTFIIGIGSKSDSWKGSIDDIRLYDRVLSEQEIATLMGQGDR